MANWQNRVIDQGEQPADQFQSHERNIHTHPPAQREAVRSSLDKLGWLKPVIVNRRATGEEILIDGHERVWQAMQNDNAAVPYQVVQLTPEEETLALLALDPTARMSGYDRDNIEALLHEVQTGLDPALDSLMADLASEVGIMLESTTEGLDEPAPIDKRVQCPECGCVFDA